MDIVINKAKILKLIGERMISSVSKNFHAGGRPVKWKISARASKKHKSKKDKKYREGKTLIDTGLLMRSIHFEAKQNEVNIGTNIVYAKIHNEGGTISKTEPVRSHKRTITTKKNGKRDVMVKAHTRNISVTIPERRFLLVQKEDEEYFNKIIDKVIKEGNK